MKSNAAWQRKNQFMPAGRGQALMPANDSLPSQDGDARIHPLSAAIQERWSLFSAADLRDVSTRQELTAALVVIYRITEEQATAQVADWIADNG
jgi:hypothetical protein